MKFKTARTSWFIGGATALLFLLAAGAPALAADLKLEAQLIWGSNDAKSPDPSHKPVDAKVAEKLKRLPFKWTSYFEVTRKQLSVPQGGATKVTMSKDCDVSVRNLGNASVEVTLFGKGQPVGKFTQALPKGELLVTGGNAANFTSWFVVLRQTD
jgi:hypothetical protein